MADKASTNVQTVSEISVKELLEMVSKFELEHPE
jgi:hypothetical protein